MPAMGNYTPDNIGFFDVEIDLETGVFLNSSEINYDLSPLEEMEKDGFVVIYEVELYPYPGMDDIQKEMVDGSFNGYDDVEWIPGTYYIYRSHYDPDLGVVINEIDESLFIPDGGTFENDFEALEVLRNIKGLSVNIVIPSKFVRDLLEIEWASLQLDFEIELNDTLIEFMENLSYEEAGSGGSNMTFGDEEFSTSELIFNKGAVDIHFGSGNLGWTWDANSNSMVWDISNTTNSSIIWLEGIADGINDSIDQDVKDILEFLNVDTTKWDYAERGDYSIPYWFLEPTVPIDPDEFDWVAAIRTELKWLIEKSIISGLSDEMIGNIAKNIRPGSEMFISSKFDDPEPLSYDEIPGFHDMYSFSTKIDKILPSQDLGSKTPDGRETFPYATLGVIGAIIILVALGSFSYTRLKRRAILDNINRKNIFEYIKANPGIHFKALLRELSFKPGAMSYHLNVLEKGEFIKSIQDGNYRRFYLYGTKSDLKIALTTIQLRILSVVDERPGISQAKISEAIGKNRMLVNYHIKILADAGVLSMEKSGRESQCFTTDSAANYLTG